MTIATMTTRILNEIKRPHLTTETQEAIISAIDHYGQAMSFYFQHERAELTLSTSVSPIARLYSLPSDFAWPYGRRAMTIKAFDARYPIDLVTWREMEESDLESTGAGIGVPWQWAYYDQAFRFYPVVPLGTQYVARLNYIKVLDETDSHWYDAAERMIRRRAKWYLYNDVIQQYDKADRQVPLMMEAEDALKGFGNRRSTTGRIRAQY